MTVLSQSVIDSLDTNWLGHNLDTLYPRASVTMTALTTYSTYAATNAKDGDTTTYWENDYTATSKDTAWLKADCGSKINISKAVINWDTLWSGKSYNFQGSNDAASWTTLSSVANNTNITKHRKDTLSNLGGSYRYFRMSGVARNGSGNGYKIDEMSLYAYKNISNRTQFGNYTVQWTINVLGSTKFMMQTMAWDSLQKWGLTFKTPLNQYIELGHDSLLTAADSVYAGVTFYDYHSNRTNPEFEQPCLNASQTGMVGTFLDASRKPVLGPTPCMDYNIAKWFRPNTMGDSADSMIPIYHYTTLQYTTVDSSACAKTLRRWRRCSPFIPWDCPVNTGIAGCYGEWGNASCNEVDAPVDGQNPKYERTYPASPLNDTAYKNMVFQDSLQFVCINHTTGTYQFNKVGFWPLDGKGFGAEWTAGFQKTNDTACEPDTSKTHLAPGVWPHNFSFTMTMNRTFVKTPHDTFQFTGDDDIWLFLNNRLVMDLGGPHAGGSMTVLIDTCFKHTGAGGTLVPGDTMMNNGTYNFDFFYCERHSTNSDCEITTNMLTMKPVASTRRSFSRSYGNLN